MLNRAFEDYISAHTTPEDELLAMLNHETNLRVMYPRMLSGQVQGKFLEFISRMIRPYRVLEIGTYTGYSAICLARGLAPGGKLFTIEVNPELEEIAARYFRLAGPGGNIVQLTGDATHLIPGISEDFDLVYLDAAKDLYPVLYELVLPKIKKGGFLIADNIFWDGKVLDHEKKPDRETRGLIEFTNIVQTDARVENVLLSVRDGLMLIRKL